MKTIALSIVAAAVLIGGAIMLSRGGAAASGTVPPADNVSVVDGKQIVEIRAKGGYQPRASLAKAGVPTLLRFNTDGTFDCSASVRIPALDISKVLPQSGSTDIDVGIVTDGILYGTCGMGMYPFQVQFQS